MSLCYKLLEYDKYLRRNVRLVTENVRSNSWWWLLQHHSRFLCGWTKHLLSTCKPRPHKNVFKKNNITGYNIKIRYIIDYCVRQHRASWILTVLPKLHWHTGFRRCKMLMAGVRLLYTGHNGRPWSQLSRSERIYQIVLLEAKLWPSNHCQWIYTFFSIFCQFSLQNIWIIIINFVSNGLCGINIYAVVSCGLCRRQMACVRSRYTGHSVHKKFSATLIFRHSLDNTVGVR